MRIVALEEHFSLPTIAADTGSNAPRKPAAVDDSTMPVVVRNVAEKMIDLGTGRIADMDRFGISVQVLSKAGNHIGPGADLFDGAEAVAFARNLNNELARRVAERPDRFAAFAHLPVSIPESAADELERTVTEHGFKGALISGTIRGAFLDDPKFAPLLARAEQLEVPLYIHPGMPPANVRKAYYDGFAPKISFGLATFGWGWHYETALHIMRLAVSGTLDMYPRLNWIIGHMGEGLPAMLARCEHQFATDLSYLSRPLSKTITDQVYVTSSGFFTIPPFMVALETFGIDRLMFAVDYPYSSNEDGRAFLNRLPLSKGDLAKVAHRNADRLLKLKPVKSTQKAHR
ncbi:MAG: amidohydrolase [Bradyrhizobiaceae bacterium]|nr:amidohydrolase [Bradyrhizobiaceae bacterium]